VVHLAAAHVDLREAVVHGVLHLTAWTTRADRGRDARPAARDPDVVAPPAPGFVALAGRPNVGKSTLVNAMVGRKVAIVSDKPQTTAAAIRAVATHDDSQLVSSTCPACSAPRTR
jgi:50S ribosomal subunit-associated GTPase HflX